MSARAQALACRDLVDYWHGPLFDHNVSNKALYVLRCSHNRVLCLFDTAIRLIDESAWPVATLAARALMTCVAYNSLMYFKLLDGAGSVDVVVDSFFTSNDVKRKLYKNVAALSKLHIAKHAKPKVGVARSARISSGDAMKSGLGRLFEEQRWAKKESILEHYDRLSEACHDSQVSIIYMFSSLGKGVETSEGEVDFDLMIEHDVWQALAHIAPFQWVRVQAEPLYAGLR
ncbi:hypothetical protein [Maricaulis sp.]|uniref:hypothetical protein n=1 Tax=Maricaulis sp. TaxID=1486257 RepID=UPI003A8EDACA